MQPSVLEDFESPVTELVLVIGSLNTLETALPIVWREKQINPALSVKAIFLREVTLTGSGKPHPLFSLTCELVDQMAIPNGFSWLQWRGKVDNPKLEMFFVSSSPLSRLMNLVVSLTKFTTSLSTRQVARVLGIHGRGNIESTVTMFDYEYVRKDAKYRRFLEGIGTRFALGVSHVSTLNSSPREPCFTETRADGSYFVKHLSFLSEAKQIRILFDAAAERQQIGRFTVTSPTIERFSKDWVQWVAKRFEERMSQYHDLITPPFGLLISRGGSKKNRKLRKQQLIDVRRAFEQVGLRPLILLHPSEKLNKHQLIGWRVVDNVHYSLMIASAQQTVSFGSQIAEDAWRSGKKLIEYGPATSGSPSEFFKLGMTEFVDSASGLKRLLESRMDSWH